MKNWFYVDSENQRHQVTEEQMQSLADSGVIKPATLVWTEGQAEWLPANQAVSALFGGASSAPPPPLPSGWTTKAFRLT